MIVNRCDSVVMVVPIMEDGDRRRRGEERRWGM